jgi:hypothetical protein
MYIILELLTDIETWICCRPKSQIWRSNNPSQVTVVRREAEYNPVHLQVNQYRTHRTGLSVQLRPGQ